MAQIAGLWDSRQEGPPGDIGVFQATASVIVYPFTFSGTTYIVAQRMGVQGWTLVSHGTDARTVIQAAVSVGGKTFIKSGNYIVLVSIFIPSNTSVEGEGKTTHLQTENNIQIFTAAGTGMLHKTGISIRNLYLTGSNAGNTQVGVYFSYIEDSIIDGVWIDDMGRDGVQLLQDSLRCIVSNNIVKNCEDDGISLNNAEQNIIKGNTCNGMTYDGIHIVNDSNENTVIGNICTLNEDNGIRVSSVTVASNNNTIVGNICEENTGHGIFLEAGDHGIVDGNVCLNNTGTGIMLSSFHKAVISNNLASGNTLRGIYLSLSSDCTVDGNICTGNTLHGINLYNNSGNTVTGNICNANVQHGIALGISSNNILVGNICNENDSGDTNTYDGINITNDSDDNLVHSNICNDNDRRGVFINTANCDRNWVKNNQLRGNTTAAFGDLGTDTKLETIPLYIASYNVTDVSESEDGLVVDDVGEWVSFVGQLPLHVQQVVRFEIWAVGLAAPGAGNQMCLTIEIEGGADDEPKTQHDTGALAGQLNTTENTAVNDIIHWVCTHANALALLGGDSVKCVCRYNAAVASDIATNAAFRRVLAHIV